MCQIPQRTIPLFDCVTRSCKFKQLLRQEKKIRFDVAVSKNITFQSRLITVKNDLRFPVRKFLLS